MLVNDFENKATLEAKIASLIDKAHSASTFIKYSAEQDIDMDNPLILDNLRNHPFIVAGKKEGKDLGDLFYEFHRMSIKMSPEEIERYNISTDDANTIVSAVLDFLDTMHKQKKEASLLVNRDLFPKEAIKYNRYYE